jgi:hypothetical protein
MYRAIGYRPLWVGRLTIEDGACGGTCAFYTPACDLQVEFGYFPFPGHEGRGPATRMAASLILMAGSRTRASPSPLRPSQRRTPATASWESWVRPRGRD